MYHWWLELLCKCGGHSEHIFEYLKVLDKSNDQGDEWSWPDAFRKLANGLPKRDSPMGRPRSVGTCPPFSSSSSEWLKYCCSTASKYSIFATWADGELGSGLDKAERLLDELEVGETARVPKESWILTVLCSTSPERRFGKLPQERWCFRPNSARKPAFRTQSPGVLSLDMVELILLLLCFKGWIYLIS
jgi:hypothetical protein